MKRVGPEIKMPKVGMPRFLVDLYRDLDDRHLMPIVILLVIALIAIPFVLSDSGNEEDGAGAAAVATPSTAPGTQQGKLVFVNENPSLRQYKHRLEHLHATDPFAVPGGSGAEAETSSPESITEIESTTTESSSGSSTESSGANSPSTVEPGSSKGKLTYFTYAIDVRVTPVSGADGKPSDGTPTVRHELPPLVMLPGRETPALTYIGPSHDGKKAIMLVSSDVSALFGDSKCVVGSESCQLLALEPGLPETLVYGGKERTYKIELLKIEVVYSDHLERAPLGDPKNSKSKSKSRKRGLAEIQVEQGVASK
jgi:hypothetical protein